MPSKEAWVTTNPVVEPIEHATARSPKSDVRTAYSAVLRTIAEENARLRSVLGRCPRAIAVLDDVGRIAAYNGDFAELFERLPTIGGDATALFGEDHRAEVLDLLHRTESDERGTLALTLARREGGARAVSLVAATLPAGDPSARGIVLVVEDRSASVDAERGRASRLRALEVANRRRAFDLAQAIFCHDLGNAVTSTLLALQALSSLNRHGSVVAGPAAELLTRALDATHHAAELVTRARDAERRRHVSPVASGCVAELADAVLDVAGALASRDAVTLANDVDPNVEVALGPSDLMQVLANLVLNAVQAITDAGRDGTVRVWSERETDGGPRVRLHVEDDGAGIDATRLRTIFDLAVGDAPEHPRLGLAISRRIVDGVGGRIHARSTPGHGTDVVVELPEVTAPARS